MSTIRSRSAVSMPDALDSRRGSTRWTDAAVGEYLSELASDPVSVDLVAALVNGSRASFTVAETAELLSVSAKHLYSIIAAAGCVAQGVEVIRSGDRMMIPAHQLRVFLRLPDPHLPEGWGSHAGEVLVDELSPVVLDALAESLSFTVMMRLVTAGVISLPGDGGRR